MGGKSGRKLFTFMSALMGNLKDILLMYEYNVLKKVISKSPILFGLFEALMLWRNLSSQDISELY